ncbi:hypothetical protein [Kitasatospora sp. NPDC093102]|uniref:hypothetical protein n=1 Tax=Kitasatospora sp. NPDC093102 TaxID=3155069 RepID=UPI0034136A5A
MSVSVSAADVMGRLFRFGGSGKDDPVWWDSLMGAMAGQSYPKAAPEQLLASAAALRRTAAGVDTWATGLVRSAVGMPEGPRTTAGPALARVGETSKGCADTLREGAGVLEEQAAQVDYAQRSMQLTAAMTLWMVAQLMWSVAVSGGLSALLAEAVVSGARRSIGDICWELLVSLRSAVAFGVGQDALVQATEQDRYRHGFDFLSLAMSAVGGAAGALADPVGRGLGEMVQVPALLRRMTGGALGGVLGGELGTVVTTAWQGGPWDPEAFVGGAVAGTFTGGISGVLHHVTQHAAPVALPEWEGSAPQRRTSPPPAPSDGAPAGEPPTRSRVAPAPEARADGVPDAAPSTVAPSMPSRDPVAEVRRTKDADVHAWFDELPDGHQRAYTGLVGQAARLPIIDPDRSRTFQYRVMLAGHHALEDWHQRHADHASARPSPSSAGKARATPLHLTPDERQAWLAGARSYARSENRQAVGGFGGAEEHHDALRSAHPGGAGPATTHSHDSWPGRHELPYREATWTHTMRLSDHFRSLPEDHPARLAMSGHQDLEHTAFHGVLFGLANGSWDFDVFANAVDGPHCRRILEAWTSPVDGGPSFWDTLRTDPALRWLPEIVPQEAGAEGPGPRTSAFRATVATSALTPRMPRTPRTQSSHGELTPSPPPRPDHQARHAVDGTEGAWPGVHRTQPTRWEHRKIVEKAFDKLPADHPGRQSLGDHLEGDAWEAILAGLSTGRWRSATVPKSDCLAILRSWTTPGANGTSFWDVLRNKSALRWLPELRHPEAAAVAGTSGERPPAVTPAVRKRDGAGSHLGTPPARLPEDTSHRSGPSRSDRGPEALKRRRTLDFSAVGGADTARPEHVTEGDVTTSLNGLAAALKSSGNLWVRLGLPDEVARHLFGKEQTALPRLRSAARTALHHARHTPLTVERIRTADALNGLTERDGPHLWQERGWDYAAALAELDLGVTADRLTSLHALLTLPDLTLPPTATPLDVLRELAEGIRGEQPTPLALRQTAADLLERAGGLLAEGRRPTLDLLLDDPAPTTAPVPVPAPATATVAPEPAGPDTSDTLPSPALDLATRLMTQYELPRPADEAAARATPIAREIAAIYDASLAALGSPEVAAAAADFTASALATGRGLKALPTYHRRLPDRPFRTYAAADHVPCDGLAIPVPAGLRAKFRNQQVTIALQPPAEGPRTVRVTGPDDVSFHWELPSEVSGTCRPGAEEVLGLRMSAPEAPPEVGADPDWVWEVMLSGETPTTVLFCRPGGEIEYELPYDEPQWAHTARLTQRTADEAYAPRVFFVQRIPVDHAIHVLAGSDRVEIDGVAFDLPETDRPVFAHKYLTAVLLPAVAGEEGRAVRFTETGSRRTFERLLPATTTGAFSPDGSLHVVPGRFHLLGVEFLAPPGPAGSAPDFVWRAEVTAGDHGRLVLLRTADGEVRHTLPLDEPEWAHAGWQAAHDRATALSGPPARSPEDEPPSDGTPVIADGPAGPAGFVRLTDAEVEVALRALKSWNKGVPQPERVPVPDRLGPAIEQIANQILRPEDYSEALASPDDAVRQKSLKEYQRKWNVRNDSGVTAWEAVRDAVHGHREASKGAGEGQPQQLPDLPEARGRARPSGGADHGPAAIRLTADEAKAAVEALRQWNGSVRRDVRAHLPSTPEAVEQAANYVLRLQRRDGLAVRTDGPLAEKTLKGYWKSWSRENSRGQTGWQAVQEAVRTHRQTSGAAGQASPDLPDLPEYRPPAGAGHHAGGHPGLTQGEQDAALAALQEWNKGVPGHMRSQYPTYLGETIRETADYIVTLGARESGYTSSTKTQRTYRQAWSVRNNDGLTAWQAMRDAIEQHQRASRPAGQEIPPRLPDLPSPEEQARAARNLSQLKPTAPAQSAPRLPEPPPATAGAVKSAPRRGLRLKTQPEEQRQRHQPNPQPDPEPRPKARSGNKRQGKQPNPPTNEPRTETQPGNKRQRKQPNPPTNDPDVRRALDTILLTTAEEDVARAALEDWNAHTWPGGRSPIPEDIEAVIGWLAARALHGPSAPKALESLLPPVHETTLARYRAAWTTRFDRRGHTAWYAMRLAVRRHRMGLYLPAAQRDLPMLRSAETSAPNPSAPAPVRRPAARVSPAPAKPSPQAAPAAPPSSPAPSPQPTPATAPAVTRAPVRPLVTWRTTASGERIRVVKQPSSLPDPSAPPVARAAITPGSPGRGPHETLTPPSGTAPDTTAAPVSELHDGDTVMAEADHTAPSADEPASPLGSSTVPDSSSIGSPTVPDSSSIGSPTLPDSSPTGSDLGLELDLLDLAVSLPTSPEPGMTPPTLDPREVMEIDPTPLPPVSLDGDTETSVRAAFPGTLSTTSSLTRDSVSRALRALESAVLPLVELPETH